MKAKLAQIMPFLGCLVMLQSVTAVAQDSDPKFSLSAGVDITSGNYGGDVDIEDTYVPLTAKVDYGRIAFRLTVPYLSVKAPEGTIFDSGGEPLPGSGALTTESGLGDIIGSVTVYDVVSSQRLGLAMDLTGKVKFGTADEDKGLGTGESDYSVRADFFKFADQLTLLGSVGYKFRGDPTGIDLDNVLMASVGGTYKFTPDVRGGLIFDYRESTISGSDSIQELTGFVSRRISEDWRIHVYALTGFTDSSPDWGGGVQIKRALNR
ncbi:MAG: hypothetical protein OEU90_04470 [Gammaproteobacteria bacterium]|nr:hypothetical protein [Gammaproteobacteria bacterium]MDH3750065.1 hypothetical protein [Gammaproteobacteria bacterium]MDH3804713.1 hypothetical protein [Gammaproteobacteria bacterium]